jgi:hypothetical protein
LILSFSAETLQQLGRRESRAAGLAVSCSRESNEEAVCNLTLHRGLWIAHLCDIWFGWFLELRLRELSAEGALNIQKAPPFNDVNKMIDWSFYPPPPSNFIHRENKTYQRKAIDCLHGLLRLSEKKKNIFKLLKDAFVKS